MNYPCNHAWSKKLASLRRRRENFVILKVNSALTIGFCSACSMLIYSDLHFKNPKIFRLRRAYNVTV